MPIYEVTYSNNLGLGDSTEYVITLDAVDVDQAKRYTDLIIQAARNDTQDENPKKVIMACAKDLTWDEVGKIAEIMKKRNSALTNKDMFFHKATRSNTYDLAYDSVTMGVYQLTRTGNPSSIGHFWESKQWLHSVEYTKSTLDSLGKRPVRLSQRE